MNASLPQYDPMEEVQYQDMSYDCSQQSLSWCVWAWGRTPEDDWMEASLQAGGYMNAQVGCTDASGAGLAQWTNETYGSDGYVASNQNPVSFDELAAEAGTLKHPICA